MQTVNATQLKNRLGEVLAQAVLGPVAIERHGRVVAYLVPAKTEVARAKRKADKPKRSKDSLSRRDEERIAQLCARADFRPSRWQRAGDARTLAGVAVMLASQHGFDRMRMLALAERLHPGMSRTGEFSRWLRHTRVQAGRLLPMIALGQQQASRGVRHGDGHGEDAQKGR